MFLPTTDRGRHRAPALRRRLILLGVTAGAVLLIAAAANYQATAKDAGGPTRSSGSRDIVPGSFIVALKDSADLRARGVDAVAHELAGEYGGRLGRVYSHALNGYSVSMSDASAKRLAADEAVASVNQNVRYRLSGTQTKPPSWGLDRIDQRALPVDGSYTFPNTASNVHAYILDTGIRFTHTTFGGRATAGFDAITSGGTASDCNGHGTHVAGTVGGNEFGVAKGVALVAVRVLDCNGDGTTESVTAGVDWVTAHATKPAVANLSLGGDLDPVLDAAVTNSINAGVTYSIAAGNDNADACTSSPGRVPAAITVGASDAADRRATFSDIGPCVDLFAPGQSIVSSWDTGDTATMLLSGTSMATPHVTGAAALIASANPGFTPQQIRDAIVGNATNSVLASVGTGSPNRLLFVGATAATPPAPSDFAVTASPTAGSTAAGGTVTTTVSTSGTAQPVALSVRGVPAGATAALSPTSVTTGGASKLTVTTTAATAPGTYPLTVTGTGTTTAHDTTFSLTVTAGGGTVAAGCSGTNGTDVPIPDAAAAVNSPITISGCDRNASATARVEVHIVHPYRGDLRVTLVAPDGSTYQLKTSNPLDNLVGVDGTFVVNLSSEAANGGWQLRVQDAYTSDTGFLNGWTLTL